MGGPQQHEPCHQGIQRLAGELAARVHEEKTERRVPGGGSQGQLCKEGGDKAQTGLLT